MEIKLTHLQIFRCMFTANEFIPHKDLRFELGRWLISLTWILLQADAYRIFSLPLYSIYDPVKTAEKKMLIASVPTTTRIQRYADCIHGNLSAFRLGTPKA